MTIAVVLPHMYQDLLFQIALTKVDRIGDVHARALMNVYENAEAVFKARSRDLERIEGIGKIKASSIKKFNSFDLCENEIRFIEKNNITPVFCTAGNYPKRLVHCYDSPILLYTKGNANLNASKMIAVVGTRNNSEYGKIICQKFIQDLSGQNITIISGLAYGIDTIAHKSALENKLPTIAVLAHGLDRIYPSSNTTLAKEITQHGGLITDFTSGTKPDKQNFPMRNRITAGLCDALVVVESGIKGGSLITAEIAHSYNKDVMAFPGRTSDNKSAGCNGLIKQQKAIMIESASDLLETLGWVDQKKSSINVQRELFMELSPEEKLIINVLEQNRDAHIDLIAAHTKLNHSTMAKSLLNLEINGMISAMPGNRYRAL